MIKDEAGKLTSIFSMLIFLFLAPCVYYLAKGILGNFEDIFEEPPDKLDWSTKVGFPRVVRVEYLFSNKTDFERYRQTARQMLYSVKEKALAIAISFGVIMPLVLLQDYQNGTLQLVLSTSQSFVVIAYVYWILYWGLVYSLLLSVVWMIMTVVRALLNLEKEKPHLHITKIIIDTRSNLLSEKSSLTQTRIGLLDFSFRRFRAGLSSIANFVFSSSLKIAFVGVLTSLPALMYFLITRKIMITWYSLCLFSITLSILVFVLGQYGVWRLWKVSKEDAVNLLDQICTIKTQQCEQLRLQPSIHSREIEGIHRDLEFVDKLANDLNNILEILSGWIISCGIQIDFPFIELLNINIKY